MTKPPFIARARRHPLLLVCMASPSVQTFVCLPMHLHPSSTQPPQAPVFCFVYANDLMLETGVTYNSSNCSTTVVTAMGGHNLSVVVRLRLHTTSPPLPAPPTPLVPSRSQSGAVGEPAIRGEATSGAYDLVSAAFSPP